MAAITPFNSRIMSTTKIAPALAAGNTMVHKPAVTPALTALRLADVLAEAGVPDGVFGGQIGEALANHPGTDSWPSPLHRDRPAGGPPPRAAARLIPATADLGGESANIVFADADLDATSPRCSRSVQRRPVCMAGAALLVQRPVYEEFLARIVGGLQHIPVGNPRSSPRSSGRHSERQRTTVMDMISRQHRRRRRADRRPGLLRRP